MTRARRIALIAGAIMLAAAACGRGIDEGATGVTTLGSAPGTTTSTTAPAATTGETATSDLVVWVPVRQQSAVREAASNFTTATGIGVTIEAVELDDMEAAINAGVGPDLFMGNHTWLARLARRGLAAPVGLESRLDEFDHVAADAFTYEGVVYGAPVTLESIALFHNSSLVPTAPGAMSEIKEICLQLRGDDVTTTTGTSTTTTTLPPAFGCLEYVAGDGRISIPLVTAGDAYLYRRVEDAYISDDVGLAGASAISKAETLRSLVADGVIAGAEDQSSMVERFASGETPFLLGDIQLAEAISASGTQFGVAPLPIITGATPAPFVIVTGFMLAGRSNNSDTALLFLSDYLVTEITMADLFAASTGLPAYGATAELVATDPVLAGLQAAADRGEPTPTVDGIDEVLTTVGLVVADILVTDGEDVAEILNQAAELALSLVAP